MREALEAIKSKPNNWQDALIASVALKNGYSLVTADKDLANVAISFGINVHHVQA
jgi:predicted nucleic acid-binding protein